MEVLLLHFVLLYIYGYMKSNPAFAQNLSQTRTQHAYLKTPHYKTLADQQYRTGW